MKKHIIILFFGLAYLSHAVYPQQSRTMFFMHDLPQSGYLNPAVQPKCRVFVGIPALTSTYINASSTGIAYNDLSPGEAKLDLERISRKLKSINYVTADLHVNLLSVGIRRNDFFYWINIAEKVDAKVFYPKAIFSLATEGNDQFVGSPMLTRSLGASAHHLREYSLGIAQDVDWNYKWGVRGKLLFGKANISTRKSAIELTTSPTAYDLTANWAYQLNAAFPLTVPNADGGVDIESIEVGEIDLMKYLFNINNIGFAFDFGTFFISEPITWSISVIDLGVLYWRSDVNKFSNSGSLAFNGVTVDDDFEPEDYLQMVTDSLTNQLVLNHANGTYTTFLPTKLNIGATYELHPKFNAGLLVRTEFYPRRPVPSLTLSINSVEIKNFAASLSYSIMNGSYNNIGLGVAVGIKNFTFHAVSDNLPGFFWPHKTHTANLRFGLHLNFGCNKSVKSFKHSGPGCHGVN